MLFLAQIITNKDTDHPVWRLVEAEDSIYADMTVTNEMNSNYDGDFHHVIIHETIKQIL
jgi:hypothetical protein